MSTVMRNGIYREEHGEKLLHYRRRAGGEGTAISINPLVIWAWAGLLINAINSIPAGELDGGRISFALWGRKV